MNIPSLSSSSGPQTVARESTGFNALSAEDFLKMMIVQLQNQDPLEPTGNEELLNQISQMRSLQSSIELSEALKSVTSQQKLSSAASLIGKSVTGTITLGDGTETTLEGIVERAFLKGGEAFVGLPDGELAVENISSVE
jgi:flagellar basal-body rod modification protein FlgD